MTFPRARGLLIAGTSSDAGKSLVVTGLCRHFARLGITVAPFKAQNMSNNSMVCADGAEIGRAQFLQAQAARAEPESAMNPVLLKPGSDLRSFVVVRGQPYGVLDASNFVQGRAPLAAAAYEAYEDLAGRYDLIVTEGAGSPAEINLRENDYVNLGLAQRFGLPVVIVGDIDRGGVLASIFGTVGLLDPADRALMKGYLINKFRGDVSLLEPGLVELSERIGVPSLGVLPWLNGVELDSEDGLQRGGWSIAETGERVLRVAVLGWPRVSNATDVDALVAEPGVEVMVTRDGNALASADLVVLPGSRSTVADLAWARQTGLAEVLIRRARQDRPILGICGGYQMLASVISDAVESASGEVPGLGLLPTRVDFAEAKSLGRPRSTWRGHPVEGYEIHHGIATVTGEAEPFLDGVRVGQIWGTMWHGTLESDDFRRAWLREIAAAAGSAWTPSPEAVAFADRREQMIDTLADAIGEHTDVAAILELAGVS